jgi:5'-nucleotidase
LQDSRVYRIATNDFMRSGGDGYAVLRDAAIDPYDTGPGLADLTASHITAASPLAPADTGWLTLQ